MSALNDVLQKYSALFAQVKVSPAIVRKSHINTVKGKRIYLFF